MLQTGLVSVTFRPLSVREVAALVREGGLDGVEWGGDVHVPHGEIATAKEARQITEGEGLSVLSYGSYYRVAESEAKGLAFESVVETARALGAPGIRVWAGSGSPSQVEEGYFEKVADESRRIAEIAHAAGLWVSYEFHGNTMTETNASALRLLELVNHPNVKTHWQSVVGITPEERLAGLAAVLPWLMHFHVFHWRLDDAGQLQRLPLAEGKEEWVRYASTAQETGRTHALLLEFVRGDDPDAFREDAAALREIVEAAQKG